MKKEKIQQVKGQVLKFVYGYYRETLMIVFHAAIPTLECRSCIVVYLGFGNYGRGEDYA
ncbi:MAG TPA: hypothetical protein VMT26_00775 [Candidatus Bathyarchaeia archaeon]|nr:hypothetical protein [Candidatus Bathyarchaeia archaeon]